MLYYFLSNLFFTYSIKAEEIKRASNDKDGEVNIKVTAVSYLYVEK